MVGVEKGDAASSGGKCGGGLGRASATDIYARYVCVYILNRARRKHSEISTNAQQPMHELNTVRPEGSCEFIRADVNIR